MECVLWKSGRLNREWLNWKRPYGHWEGGQLALNDSFEAYKRGAELYQKLKAMLDEGEARITMLTKEGESEIARPEQ